MQTVLSIAVYIINSHTKSGEQVTPMKLQKLLYYTKAWGLVAGKSLFRGAFKKWEYGPVNQKVYNQFKSYGRDPIPTQSAISLSMPEGEKKQLIDFITHCYGQYDALALSTMTHREEPWLKTEANEIIKDDLIKNYYSKHPFARNFPFDPENNPFYPLESDLSKSFTMDMSKDDAIRATVYSSYNSYLAHLQKATGEFDEWFNTLLK